MLTNNDYRRWLKDCLTVGITAISIDTSARIMAVLYEYGNNEGFTFNEKFLAEMDYIQDRFGLREMKVPDKDFTILLKQYIKELELYQKVHKDDQSDNAHPFRSIAPDWAPKLLKDRYNMKFIG